MLHSPEKKSDHVSIDTEVHLALTPLEPIVFFGFHKRMSVTGYSLSFAVLFFVYLLRRLIVVIHLFIFFSVSLSCVNLLVSSSCRDC